MATASGAFEGLLLVVVERQKSFAEVIKHIRMSVEGVGRVFMVSVVVVVVVVIVVFVVVFVFVVVVVVIVVFVVVFVVVKRMFLHLFKKR